MTGRRNNFRSRRPPPNYGSLPANVNQQDNDVGSDLPGFYYDDEKKRYFRIVPGQNHDNPITAASIRAQKAARRSAEISEASRKRTVNPIPRTLNSLQLGSLRNTNFASSVRSSKMVSLVVSSETDFTAASMEVISAMGGAITDVEECTYLIGCPRKGILVGSWATKSAGGKRGSLLRCLKVDQDGVKPGEVVNIHPLHKVVDLCVTEKDYRLYVTYACVNSDCTKRPSTIVSTNALELDEHFRSPPDRESREFPSSAVWCCARSPDNQKTAVGLEGRAEIMDENGSRKLQTRRENPFSLRFNGTGDVLHVGTNKGNLLGIDLRSSSLAFSIHIGRGVSYIGPLDSEDTLLASAYDGKLVAVDLRERKVVCEYKGHSNEGIKIPFSYDRADRAICSAGQDGIVRVWQYDGGEDKGYEPVTAVVPPDGQHLQPWCWYSSSWCCIPGKTALCLTSGRVGYVYT